MSRRKFQIDAVFQQGARRHAAGRLGEAEQLYRQVLDSEPRHPNALHMLGVLALQLGHPAPAAGLIAQAIAIKPTEPMYRVNLANALLALHQPDQAATEAHAAIRLQRTLAEAYQALGHALTDLGRAEDAVAAYRDARQRKPTLRDIDNNLGLALCEANRLEEAVGYLETAARQAQDDPQAHNNLAGVLRELGRLDAAEAHYRQAIRLTPTDPTPHVNLAIALLLGGRLREGWQEWEWRFQARPETALGFDQPPWAGEALHGRTLLLHAEQGFGDTIQFCRYVPRVPANGPRILVAHPSLVPLLRSLAGGVEVRAIGGALPHIDLRCPLLSLPRVMRTDEIADIPADIPYLRAEPARVARWRSRTAALPGLRVGLVWSGNPDDARLNRRRSVPVAALTPLASVPGVSLVSLQVDQAAPQLGGAPPLGAVIHDWTAELSDFAETAALIDALDLVISVDTAVVHLAGALGKPVWLMNRFDTCWRWLLGRDDSPWYPTLRQFRQPAAGRWDDVVARVAASLADAAKQHGSAPISETDTGARTWTT